jgi:phosphoribosyl-ATP pyrophosphohydrolase/phosphoribosyl-AMP cyclohydrolase
VEPVGPTCHTGGWTCFGSNAAAKYSLEELYRIIADRFANPTPGSYTATLDNERVREKVMEEAQETVEALGKADVTGECADLLYFLSVLMCREKVTWKNVLDELDRRRKK